MKIALVCPGIGQVQRGYERFFIDLRDTLAGHAEVALFAGARGDLAHARVPWFASRNGVLRRRARLHALLRRSPYELECHTYAVGLVPHLRRARYDVVHFIDPPLLKPMHFVRRALRGTYRLLFTFGGVEPVPYPPWVDHAHHIAPQAQGAALDLGMARERATLLPIGVRPERFAARASREELRRRAGIAPSTLVVLSVAALNRAQKRIDWLIEEAAQVPGDLLLWVDGSLEPDGDPTLLDLARQKLGARCRITHVPTAELGDLLEVADVHVLASEREAFGLAAVEALVAGLPVLVHDAPHFRWLVANDASLVDMTRRGALAARLRGLLEGRAGLRALCARDAARRRFDWDALRGDYLDMYARVARQPLRRGAWTDWRGAVGGR